MGPSPILEYSGTGLTRLQRKTLAFYVKLHKKPPSMGRLLLAAWRAHAILLVVGAAGFAYMFAIGAPAWALGMGGLVIGAFFRDIGNFRRMVAVWPALDRVIDWGRLGALVGAAPDAPAAAEVPGSSAQSADGEGKIEK